MIHLKSGGSIPTTLDIETLTRIWTFAKTYTNEKRVADCGSVEAFNEGELRVARDVLKRARQGLSGAAESAP